MKILIVDDYPDNIKILEAMLRKAGHDDLASACSAAEAFLMLGQSAPPVDLVLMDVMMPEVSGIEACKKIKDDARFKDLPVLMVTARTDMECLGEAFEAGAMDYIVKPVRRLELLARVNSALKLRHETEERKKREQDLRLEKENLEKALSEIQILRGFLPICAYCKKIRDIQGLWHQLEAYLMSHSDVKFTHGICEHCLKSHYPDMADRVTDKVKKHSHPND